MGLVSKTYTFASGAIILASEHNTNFDTLFTLVNGQLDNANLSASAGIIDTKLNTITTAGKVNASAITGTITKSQLDTGNSANQIVCISGTDDVLPALDGSLIYNVSVASSSITSAQLGTGSASASNFLRGDRTWAAVSTGAPVTSAYTANTAGVTYSNLSANVCSVDKTITSGNTVYLNATGFTSANPTQSTAHNFILYAGATSVQTVKLDTLVSGSVVVESGWALNGVVSGLSGATTFKVIAYGSNGYNNTARGNLSVLEF